MVVTLTNPVPVALTDVELHTHYEGCIGKPGTRSETTVDGELGLGAQASARVPTLVQDVVPNARGHNFGARSVQLVARGEGVVIDLDVSFERLGVPIECPRG